MRLLSRRTSRKRLAYLPTEGRVNAARKDARAPITRAKMRRAPAVNEPLGCGKDPREWEEWTATLKSVLEAFGPRDSERR